MANLSSKTCLVMDNGLFVDVAERLARSFGKVYYATSWRQPFPKSRDLMVGEGFESFERVKWEAKLIDQVDCIVCPDVNLGDYQELWRRQGIPVWGPGAGERIELDRVWAKQLFEQLGLDTGKYEVVQGLDRLRKFLKENPEVYVKSQFRGDFETIHAESGEYEEWEDWLDEQEFKLGAVGKRLEIFLCEWPIKTKVETGFDGWCIDGRFPSTAMEGVEVKDKGMAAVFKPYEELSEPVRLVNARLAPALRYHHYRGFLSTEIRDYTLIDPCCRCGSPSHELLLEAVENLPEVVWAGAHGELVQPVFRAEYGVILVIQSQWAEDNWQRVRIPEELRQWVKLKNHCRLLERDTVVPQPYHLQQIGGVVALGASLKEATATAERISKEIKGIDIKVNAEILEEAAAGLKRTDSMSNSSSSNEDEKTDTRPNEWSAEGYFRRDLPVSQEDAE